MASSGLNRAARSRVILKAAIIKLCRVNPILLPSFSPSCRAFLIKTTTLSLARDTRSRIAAEHCRKDCAQFLREYVFLKLYAAFHAYVIVMFNKMGDIAALEDGVEWAREGGRDGANGRGTTRPLQFLEKYRPRLA